MSKPFINPCGADPHCGACEHRVNEKLHHAGTLTVWMACYHPDVLHDKCEMVRAEGGKCGPTAALFSRHPGAPQEPVQGALL